MDRRRHPLNDADSIVSIPAVPLDSAELARFSDAAMHFLCFGAWSHRGDLIDEVNAFHEKRYRGMRFMQFDGSIEERDPHPGYVAQPFDVADGFAARLARALKLHFQRLLWSA